MPKTVKIDNKAFFRTVAALVVPMAIQNLINVAVQGADVIMLGRVGETVLSAASLAGQVQFVMMLIFFGLASGASVLTAQYWGKGDTRTIEKVMCIAIRIAFVVAILFACAAWLIPHRLMRIFTPEPELIAEGVKYLQVVAFSYIFTGLTTIYLNIMRSVEKVVISTIIYFISFVNNVLFNAVLIFGLFGLPRLGIVGAALGTTLARFIELIIVIIYAARNPVLRIRRKDMFARHKTIMKDFMRYAAPTTINELIWGMAMSANAVIIGHLGSAAVAANSVAQVTRQLATVFSFGVAGATAIIIGKAIGGGEPEKAEAYAKRMILTALATGCFGSIVIFCLRPAILRTMRLSPLAEDYLAFVLLFLCLYVIAQAFTATMVVGISRGGGDTRFGLVLDTCTMWGCSILLASIAAFVLHWPVKVVFVLIMCDEFIKIPFCLARYKSKRWLQNVTR